MGEMADLDAPPLPVSDFFIMLPWTSGAGLIPLQPRFPILPSELCE